MSTASHASQMSEEPFSSDRTDRIPHILVVDDEPDIRELLCYNLGRKGYRCSCVGTACEAIRVMQTRPVDLGIVDIILPDMSGLEILKTARFRNRLPRIPVLLLSARGEVTDRLLGFELGADDYVVKPFSLRELLLRVQSILARTSREEKELDRVAFQGVEVEPATRSVRVEGTSVDLTRTEFNLLLYLMENQTRVLSREQLLKRVWHYRFTGPSRTVDTYVQRLRRKLGRKGRLIQTVRGIGYKFAAPDRR